MRVKYFSLESDICFENLWYCLDIEDTLNIKELYDMPKDTEVDKIYQAIKRKTGDKGKAARIAQSITGKSLKTGKKPKKRGKKK